MRFAFWKRQAPDRAPPETKGASFLVGLVSTTAMNRNYLGLATEGYAQNPVAKRCISLLATSAASVELKVFREKRGKAEPLDKHPLLDLLAAPNPMQSGKGLIDNIVRYLAISGNAFLYGAMLGTGPSEPNALYLFRPDCVEVKKGLDVLPLGYEYTLAGGTKVFYPIDRITGYSQVLHFKDFHPTDALNGLSPMVAGAAAIDQHNDAAQWNRNLLKNGARPAGAFVVVKPDGTSATLGEEQYQRLKEQLDSQVTGSGNAGRPLLLEGGLDWKEMSLSPKDMDFIKGKDSSARDIALAFGIPPMLLGIPGDNTFSNYQEARLALWIDTVLPLLGQILDRLNRWLEFLYGPDVYVWYDEDSIPALETMRAEKTKRINDDGTLTLNEKRIALGRDDIGPDGDTHYIESSKIPLDLVGMPELPEPDSPDDEPDEEQEDEAA